MRSAELSAIFTLNAQSLKLIKIKLLLIVGHKLDMKPCITLAVFDAMAVMTG